MRFYGKSTGFSGSCLVYNGEKYIEKAIRVSSGAECSPAENPCDR